MASSEIRYQAGTSTAIRATADRTVMDARGTRDGAFYTADWLRAMMLEGRVFVANAGTATAELTFGAGAIDTTEPDFFMSVPLGTTVIPIEIRIYMEAFGTSAQFECMAACGTGGAEGTDTNLVAGTDLCNLRSDAPYNSGVTCGHSSAADATYMTANVCEFWRNGQQYAVTKSGGSATASASDPNLFIWRLKDSDVAPVLIGASQMMVFGASQAGTGFITVTFVEIPSTSV